MELILRVSLDQTLRSIRLNLKLSFIGKHLLFEEIGFVLHLKIKIYRCMTLLADLRLA